MWYRINSAFLPDTDHSDWLIEQYQDILDICQVELPETIIRSLPDYAPAPNVTYLPPGTDPVSGTNSSEYPGNCTGQTFSASDAGCNELSQKYGVTTGDLQAVTDSEDCTISDSICVASNCTLQQVKDGDTCDGLAEAFSTSSMNITTSLFLLWNANIIGFYDNLTAGQFVCSG